MSPCVAAEGAQPVASVTPSVLNVQQGQRAEFHCTVTGKPTPAVEWIGMSTSASWFVWFRLHWDKFVSAGLENHRSLQSSLMGCVCVILTGGPGNIMSPRAVIRGGVLTFTAVELADEGEYTCKALNTHGEHTAKVSLIVQSKLGLSVCHMWCGSKKLTFWPVAVGVFCLWMTIPPFFPGQSRTQVASARNPKFRSAPKMPESTKVRPWGCTAGHQDRPRPSSPGWNMEDKSLHRWDTPGWFPSIRTLHSAVP